MPTKLKKATKRTSTRKVAKPSVYGTKPDPPQRGKRLQSKVTKVTTSGTKRAPAKASARKASTGKAQAKASAKPVLTKAVSTPSGKEVNNKVEAPADGVARMPPIG